MTTTRSVRKLAATVAFSALTLGALAAGAGVAVADDGNRSAAEAAINHSSQSNKQRSSLDQAIHNVEHSTTGKGVANGGVGQSSTGNKTGGKGTQSGHREFDRGRGAN